MGKNLPQVSEDQRDQGQESQEDVQNSTGTQFAQGVKQTGQQGRFKYIKEKETDTKYNTKAQARKKIENTEEITPNWDFPTSLILKDRWNLTGIILGGR